MARGEYLKISDRMVRRLIADGELTGYFIGRGHRMLRVDLDEKLMRPTGFHWNDPAAKPRKRQGPRAPDRSAACEGLRNHGRSQRPLSASRGDRRCGANAVTAMRVTASGPLRDPASTAQSKVQVLVVWMRRVREDTARRRPTPRKR